MVFHESLNPERKFSLVTPLVFIAILGGTTGVIAIADSFSQSSYVSNPQAMLAEVAGAITKQCEAGYEYTMAKNSDGSVKVLSQMQVDCKTKYTSGPKKGRLINESDPMCKEGKGKTPGHGIVNDANGDKIDECYPGNSVNSAKSPLPAGSSGIGIPDQADIQKKLDDVTSKIDAIERKKEEAVNGMEPPITAAEEKKLEDLKTEQKDYNEMIKKMAEEDPTDGKKYPSEKDMFDAERAAKLKDEQVKMKPPEKPDGKIPLPRPAPLPKDTGAPAPPPTPVTSETTKTDVTCQGARCLANTRDSAEKKYLEGEGFKCTSTGGGYACSKPYGTREAPPTKQSGDGTEKTGGGGVGLSSLGGFLEGLMKALGTPKPPSGPVQACSRDPNVYAQQQQQYQSALQQYNYQLQQYNYQRQLNQLYDGTAPTPPEPIPPSPCRPSTESQCENQPKQPDPNSCSVGSWRARYSGACVAGWECVPNNVSAPTATLSCEPAVADAGSTIAITYGCSSGVASSSSFKVTTQPGGSATTTVNTPPAGTNTATYTLACTDQGRTTGAQCSVQVARTNIILVANPKTVPANGTSLLSWLTTGMQSCIISSPDQADFTARNSSNTSVTGAATTSAITTATSTVLFQLDCKTLSGADRQATTLVSIAP